MFSKDVIESPTQGELVRDMCSRLITPELARHIREGLTVLPDGSVRLHLTGLSRREAVRLGGLFRLLGVTLREVPPLVTVDELAEDPERVLDWVVDEGEPVEIAHRGRTLRLLPA